MFDEQTAQSTLYGQFAGTSSGFTPFLNGSLNDANPFDAHYGAHELAMSERANAVAAHRQTAVGDTFDPAVLDRATSSSSSSSRSRGSVDRALEPPQRKNKRSSTSTSNDDESFDMDDPNNSHKRAKFLERNRLAAAKCRTKKKEWTNNLEAAARQASQQTRALQAIVQNLRDEVLSCKTELMNHQNCDCPHIRQYLHNETLKNFGAYEGKHMPDEHASEQ